MCEPRTPGIEWEIHHKIDAITAELHELWKLARKHTKSHGDPDGISLLGLIDDAYAAANAAYKRSTPSAADTVEGRS